MDFVKLGIFGLSIVIMIYLSKYLIDSLTHFSRKTKLSHFFIGTLILAIGTSLPELIDASIAASLGVGELGIGDIIGSSITNLCLILGLFAVIKPIKGMSKGSLNDSLMMLVSVIIFSITIYDGVITRLNGIILVSSFIIYHIILHKKDVSAGKEVFMKEVESDYILTPIAIFGIIITGWVMVNTGASLAQDLSIPISVLGLTVLALGTSIPELFTSFIAARKGYSRIVEGNVFGSNNTNLLLVAGIASLIKPINIPEPRILLLSLSALIILIVCFNVLIQTKKKVTKQAGMMLLLFYICYLLGISLFTQQI